MKSEITVIEDSLTTYRVQLVSRSEGAWGTTDTITTEGEINLGHDHYSVTHRIGCGKGLLRQFGISSVMTKWARAYIEQALGEKLREWRGLTNERAEDYVEGSLCVEKFPRRDFGPIQYDANLGYSWPSDGSDFPKV